MPWRPNNLRTRMLCRRGCDPYAGLIDSAELAHPFTPNGMLV